ncbi:hypothetical protein [Pontibacter sp. G13]|uniref:hypothetical protein n=1 Tax=Pontibacter sp. G13 TaxID=3074898 RepID=UPI002888FCD1|nr:hypothetical protein [Pontibacter sp. G13]WNJ19035.1 hypothetical protein RJD25_00970 [Pontibacter sp. G13]
MKNLIKLILSAIMMAWASAEAQSQVINWAAQHSGTHLPQLSLGWDYGLSFQGGYGYRFASKIPWIAQANFSIPAGGNVLDDYKLGVGGKMLAWDASHFKGEISLQGVLRRYSSPLVRMNNVGTLIQGSLGYYRPRWFAGLELGWDKAWLTHFSHTEVYRETILVEAQDGWADTPTAGTISYGLWIGGSLGAVDVSIQVGKVTYDQFQTGPTIPNYLRLGALYRMGSSQRR